MLTLRSRNGAEVRFFLRLVYPIHIFDLGTLTWTFPIIFGPYLNLNFLDTSSGKIKVYVCGSVVSCYMIIDSNYKSNSRYSQLIIIDNIFCLFSGFFQLCFGTTCFFTIISLSSQVVVPTLRFFIIVP